MQAIINSLQSTCSAVCLSSGKIVPMNSDTGCVTQVLVPGLKWRRPLTHRVQAVCTLRISVSAQPRPTKYEHAQETRGTHNIHTLQHKTSLQVFAHHQPRASLPVVFNAIHLALLLVQFNAVGDRVNHRQIQALH